MRPLEDYVKHADTLAQIVINEWCRNMDAGNAAYLTAPFSNLNGRAHDFRMAQRIAENWRHAGVPNTALDADVEVMRNEFARAYKIYWERVQG